MKSFVNQLRERSRHERQAIAVIVAVCATALILAVWAVSRNATITETVAQEVEQKKLEELSPFKTLVRGLRNFVAGTRRDTEQIRDEAGL